MKIFGVIIEANPFHNGHLYLIKQIQKEKHPDLLVALTTTSFTMRGEISLLDKFTKTKILLDNGFDLVIELPFVLGTQSADYFAENSLKILNALHITDLAFGSETTDLNFFLKLYHLLDQNKQKPPQISQKKHLNELIKNEFDQNSLEIINMPNFTLGFTYIKTILDNKYQIKYHPIKRVNNNYDDLIVKSDNLTTIASGKTIRNYYQKNLPIASYLNYEPTKLIDLKMAEANLLLIYYYHFLVNDITNNLSYFGQKEGLVNYIKKHGDFNKDLNTLVNSLKNKKYSVSYIERTLLHQLLQTTNFNNNQNLYLRILGATSQGLNYLNTLPKEIKNLLFSSVQDIKIVNQSTTEILNLELKATKLYQIITNQPSLVNGEYHLPIIKIL